MNRAATERLRQERETFDLTKRHADRWFGLRLGMGYAGIILMEVVVGVCIWVILNPLTYGAAGVNWAMGVLCVDVLSQVAIILRFVMSRGAVTRLAPITSASAQATRGAEPRRRPAPAALGGEGGCG